MSLLPKELIKEIVRKGNFKSATDIQEALKDLMKEFIQESLEAELNNQLGYEKYEKKENCDNSRNGYSKKKVKSSFGEIELDIPRDRNSEFEPKIVPKYSRDISNLEEKVISMYGLGMSTRDINKHIQEIYGVDVSAEMVSKITDKIIPLSEEWQNRPLEEVYYFTFLDAIHFHVKEDKAIVKKAAYIVLGVNSEGKKDVLGIYIGGNESAKFWLSVLNHLRNRGVKDILIASVDGLTGFSEAIKTVFPYVDIQRCIIHQIRYTLSFISYKEKKEFAKDLKEIYTAPNEETGFSALEELKEKWSKKYPYALKSWENNWSELRTFFKFSPEIRRIMYTTNAIENLNRIYRKVTKTRSSFPTDMALMKLLYLSTINLTEKWKTGYAKDWHLIKGQLAIEYEERLKGF
ncbi:IS256 family transposase [Fusobacterium perfoetens]|uniref:IS256 family transposase n=1 Tax=Fusobacterium perfoetens TaxID=852 RepID=UPI001F435974|nr:IS256 family transposase [Fusobacterium perfoetens]MCF2624995.1 IS256 family transposase [Fusobacterium perfoetens]